MAVYIIAEAGVNHNGSLDLAKKLVDAAFEAHCDAVKFQTFNVDKIVTREAAKAEYQKGSTCSGESQFEMLKKLQLDESGFYELSSYCKMRGIEFLSTPFDEDSVNLLERLNVRAYKVSSGDITNKPLLQHIAAKGKPLILSTGMSTLSEVEKAIGWINAVGNKNITLMHCTTRYPTPFEAVNLNAIATMRETFNLPVGYSDHTIGISIPIAAAAIGAVIIEKHFTLDRNLPGPDQKASLEPYELVGMVKEIRNVELALGNGIKIPDKGEEGIAGIARKSIVTSKAVKKGQLISMELVCIKRPGTGLPPEMLGSILGKSFNKDLEMDHLITMEDIYG